MAFSVQLADVIEYLTINENWLAMSPKEQTNQWACCCRAFDVKQRKLRHGFVKAAVTGVCDCVPHDDTSLAAGMRHTLVDVVDVL